MNVGLVVIAKGESDYILEFLQYHLLIGFDNIILYDNEEIPTYGNMIPKYWKDKVDVIHFTLPSLEKGVQYKALDDFTDHHMKQFTHVAHIDVDEFIVLKKHKNIKDFIKEYIDSDPECAGVGINWRFFGSSGQPSPFTFNQIHPINKNPFSQIHRFTQCENMANIHIKTLFKTHAFKAYADCHHIKTNSKKMHLKSPDQHRKIIDGPFYDFDLTSPIIQINHYKSKTFDEFYRNFKRGRCDLRITDPENISQKNTEKKYVKMIFDLYDKNEVIDTTIIYFLKSLQ